MDFFVFDSESTGIPDWKAPSDAAHQPHLTELAALLVDESGQVLLEQSYVIKPDGWIIPPEMEALNGITNEYAHDVGISERDAVEMFLDLWAGRIRIAHNSTFDNRILRIACKRYFGDDITAKWKDGPYECTLVKSRPHLKAKYGTMPTLSQAYEFFTGKTLENAHRALPDARACKDVFFAIQERERKIAC